MKRLLVQVVSILLLAVGTPSAGWGAEPFPELVILSEGGLGAAPSRTRDGCELAVDELRGTVKCTFRPYETSLVDSIRSLISPHPAAIAFEYRDEPDLPMALSEAKDAGITVFTYRTDLPPAHQALRLAFFGNDQIAVGRMFGKLARQFAKDRPAGSICIIYDPTNRAHAKRMVGIVDAAFAGRVLPHGRGAARSGWQEPIGCPKRLAADQPSATNQIVTAAGASALPRIVIVVSDLPQRDSVAYGAAVTPFATLIEDFELGIFAYGTNDDQIELLKELRSTVQVGERPFQTGYEMVYAVARLHRTEPADGMVPLAPMGSVEIGVDVCREDNWFECTRGSTPSP